MSEACCDNPRISKCLNVGFPGRLCVNCMTMWGAALWIAEYVYFDGHLVLYTGSYWIALWHFLFGRWPGGGE